MAELARDFTELDTPTLIHLQRLVGSWGMLADLCFADLLLFVPVAGTDDTQFVILSQIRPTTSQTLYREDQVGRIIDLAKFLAKRGRFEESDQTFLAAQKLAPNAPKVLYARAAAYIENGRNLGTARELLEKYLASALTPDDPPRADAQKLLRQTAGG